MTYLGRKSIYMGTCRTIVIDAILKTIATLLAPLSSSSDSRLGIWRNTDLILLSWLLLFLSVCLYDNNEKKENTNPRWDFMSGESDMVKARLSMNNSNSKTISRSFKKRLIQHKSNNNSSINNISDKFYMLADGITHTLIEQPHKIDPKKYQNVHIKSSDNIEPAAYDPNTMKSISKGFKINPMKCTLKMLGNGLATTIPNTSNINTSSYNFAGPSSSSSTIKPEPANDTTNLPDSAFDRGLKSIKSQNILVVIRGLIGLLLNMDFTCNMDLFLLTCKVRSIYCLKGN